MRLDILGSSGTAPRPGNPASGYLVRSAATTIWMDAGPGTYMALLDLIDPGEIDAVLLSHMHPDHCTDVFALFHELAYVRRAARSIPVLVPDGAVVTVAAFVGGGGRGAVDSLQFIEVQPGQSSMFGDIAVTAQAAHHSVPALAFRLEASGHSVGYTGDTGSSNLVAEHFFGTDVVLAEASLQDGSEPYGFHLTARQAGELAASTRTKHLVLTHIPASLDPAESLRQATETFAGKVSLAAPGESYIIGETE